MFGKYFFLSCIVVVVVVVAIVIAVVVAAVSNISLRSTERVISINKGKQWNEQLIVKITNHLQHHMVAIATIISIVIVIIIITISPAVVTAVAVVAVTTAVVVVVVVVIIVSIAAVLLPMLLKQLFEYRRANGENARVAQYGVRTVGECDCHICVERIVQIILKGPLAHTISLCI